MKPDTVFQIACTLLLASASQGSDWPRFRGSDGSGIAPAGAKPPVVWSDTQNLKWKAPLPGPGTSSPIIVGGRIFVTCWTGPGAGGGELARQLVCIDRKTGRVQWSKTVPGEKQVDRYEGFMQEHGYASHSPASDGERVYVFFGKAGAYAFDLNGKQLWHVNLGTSSNPKNWGSASSPVIHGDLVMINASEESHALYALDRRTGKQVWKAEAASLEYVFGTPQVVTHEGQTDIVIAVPEEVWGLNPENGKLRWFADTGLPGNIAPSVVAGDGVVYAFGGFPRLGAVAVKLGGKGDVTKTHIAWASQHSTYIPTPVLHEGRLHFVSDAGFATCLDAKTGELVFKERLPGASATGRGGKPFYASPVLANGKLYAVSRRNGTFVIAAKGTFELVSHNKLDDTSQFNATPAVAGNALFLRSDKFLHCIAEGGAE